MKIMAEKNVKNHFDPLAVYTCYRARASSLFNSFCQELLSWRS